MHGESGAFVLPVKFYGIVYVCTNTTNHKEYIGQTVTSLRRRWSNHVSLAMRGGNGCRAFHGAIRKHGANSFVLSVLASAMSCAHLNVLETMLIETHRTRTKCYGYNVGLGGANNINSPEQAEVIRLKRRDPVWRARISAAKTGKPRLDREIITARCVKMAKRNKGKTMVLSDAERERRGKQIAAIPKVNPFAGKSPEERSALVRKSWVQRKINATITIAS